MPTSRRGAGGLRYEEEFETLTASIREHPEAIQAAAGGEVPECTPEERWEGSTQYAVKKPGRKTSVRVFADRVEAEALATEIGGCVEVRPGRSVRCEEYCPVRDFYPQWARMNTAGVGATVRLPAHAGAAGSSALGARNPSTGASKALTDRCRSMPERTRPY